MIQRKIPNTFAPHVRNEYFSIHDIILGLYRQVFRYEKLPVEVKKLLETNVIPERF